MPTGSAFSTPPANFTLDFETGDLFGWHKTGTAFEYQPTMGDNPTARHRYAEPGKYTAVAYVRPGNEDMFQSKMIQVIVLPSQ